MQAKSLQSCLTLCDTLNYSLPGSSVHRVLRQEYWSGLPRLPPRELPKAGIRPVPLMSPALAGGFFISSATWEAISQGLFSPNGLQGPHGPTSHLISMGHLISHHHQALFSVDVPRPCVLSNIRVV